MVDEAVDHEPGLRDRGEQLLQQEERLVCSVPCDAVIADVPA
jgi:hypothetical protein